MKNLKDFLALLGGLFLLSQLSLAQQGRSLQAPGVQLPKFDKSQVRMITDGTPAPAATSASRANTNIVIDYDSVGDNDGLSLYRMNSNLNFSGNLVSYTVRFDSLIGLDFTGYDYDSHIITVDSIDIFFTHRKTSPMGQNDTLAVTLAEFPDSGRPDSLEEVWSGGLVFTEQIGNGLFSVSGVRVRPGFAFCDGIFGVKVEFFAPAGDTMGAVYGNRRGNCATAMCTGNRGVERRSLFWPSSYYGVLLDNGMGSNALIDFPSASQGDLYSDCNGNMMFDANACELWVMQDFLIRAHVSIQDVAPTPLALSFTTTDDDGSGNGSATLSVTGGIPPYTVIWGSNPPQVGPTATNLAAGSYNVAVSYGFGCPGASDTVTIGDNSVSIDDLEAGIADLQAFPNPTQDLLTLSLEMNRTDDIRISLYDLKGQLIYGETARGVRAFRQQIDLQDALPGIYLLRVETSQGATTRRVVKQ
jgi:hypothetical protein